MLFRRAAVGPAGCAPYRITAILLCSLTPPAHEGLHAPLAKENLCVKLAGLEHEIFVVLFLYSQHRLVEYSEMFRGTIDSASVYPREVIKEAMRLNAAVVIFSHNHPSGNPEPSRADETIIKRLNDALALVDVRMLDHVIVAGRDTTSFAERGLV